MKKHVVIWGGGISGLTAAYTLHKYGPSHLKITLIEKEKRVGGYIHTLHKEGFLFERGPRGFLSSRKGKQTLQLVSELGLEKEVVVADPAAKKRYLWHKGKLQQLTPLFLLRLGFFFACLKEGRVPKGTEEETIGAFFTRRFGKKIADTLIDPLITGIFGGNLWELSLPSAWPLIHHWEQSYGSVTKGFMKERQQGELLSFRQGMEVLPARLFDYLQDKITFRLAEEAKEVEGDACISTLPTYALPFVAPQVHYETIVTLNMGWNKDVLPKRGFGYLIPSQEKESILGVSFDSAIFPRSPGKTALCVMLKKEEGALSVAQEALYRHLGIGDAPTVIDIHVSKKAIPQYEIGHQKRIKNLSFPKVVFTGNYMQGVGINDCISHAEETARTLLNSLF